MISPRRPRLVQIAEQLISDHRINAFRTLPIGDATSQRGDLITCTG